MAITTARAIRLCTNALLHQSQDSQSLPYSKASWQPAASGKGRQRLAGEVTYRRAVQSRHRSAKVMAGATVGTAIDVAYRAEPSKEVLDLWCNAEAVCFDVDSTVCTDEGIDELAAFCGAGEAVAAWTLRAMGGSVPFEVALEARLELIQPSAQQVANYLAANPPKLSPGIAELVSALQAQGIEVFLVSGGFRQMIEPVAAALSIPKSNIFANNLNFVEPSGGYAGFDPEEFTARSGGKARAVEHIKKVHGFSRVVAIGDGATDLEARRPGGADAFIGYGGVVVRAPVAKEADWFVTDFSQLIAVLKS